MSQRILVTGAAGFIGAALCERLLNDGLQVLGIDNLNDYYDVGLKRARLKRLAQFKTYRNEVLDVADAAKFNAVYRDFRPDRVVHLAAQAGVRYSIDNPHVYVDANIKGFLNVLEAVRHFGAAHLVFASSSSVYGANTAMPYSVHQSTEHPISLYAATKKANEMMAHAYAQLYGMPVTGLRFFTVYGPWGRPDMAVFSFTKKILAGETISVFNHGHHRRDFTYVDDIVEGVVRTLAHAPTANPTWASGQPDPATSRAPYRLYNIGNHQPVLLSDFIQTLERVIGRPAKLEMKEMQPGDVPDTYADVSDLERDVGFVPRTSLLDGLRAFYAWYEGYYVHDGPAANRTL